MRAWPTSRLSCLRGLGAQFAQGGTEALESESLFDVPEIAQAGGIKALRVLAKAGGCDAGREGEVVWGMKRVEIVTLTEIADVYDYLREPVSQVERNKREGKYPYYGATGQVGWIDDYKQDGSMFFWARTVRHSLIDTNRKPTSWRESVGSTITLMF
ncbi:hypothetical protein [Rhodanobacter lindaniclasticus]